MTKLHVERGFVSASVAAEIMGVSRQRVHQLLNAGRIAGAFVMDIGDGKTMWCIPRSELKAKDERREQTRRFKPYKQLPDFIRNKQTKEQT